MTQWLRENPWVTYFIIFVLLVYVYNNVFRVKKLPILKEVIVYGSMGIFSFILLMFQMDLNLPIVYSLGAAVSLMLIVRIRTWITGSQRKPKSE